MAGNGRKLFSGLWLPPFFKGFGCVVADSAIRLYGVLAKRLIDKRSDLFFKFRLAIPCSIAIDKFSMMIHQSENLAVNELPVNVRRSAFSNGGRLDPSRFAERLDLFRLCAGNAPYLQNLIP